MRRGANDKGQASGVPGDDNTCHVNPFIEIPKQASVKKCGKVVEDEAPHVVAIFAGMCQSLNSFVSYSMYSRRKFQFCSRQTKFSRSALCDGVLSRGTSSIFGIWLVIA